MKDKQSKKDLATSLTSYIKGNIGDGKIPNQDECIGFIEGFDEGFSSGIKNRSKLAATALIYENKVFEGRILGVSRKNDPNDFGLPGGKVDQGESLLSAMGREVMEETGITVLESMPIFFREHGEYVAVVFLVTSYIGEPKKMEEGEVQWVDFDTLKKGSFGLYNSQLEKHINLLKSI